MSALPPIVLQNYFHDPNEVAITHDGLPLLWDRIVAPQACRPKGMTLDDVRFGSKADMCSAQADVRFTPESGHVQCNSACPLCANSGLMRRSIWRSYSITSSARASNAGATVRSSALAALRLMASTNLVGS